jgi:hypothetical protein
MSHVGIERHHSRMGVSTGSTVALRPSNAANRQSLSRPLMRIS